MPTHDFKCTTCGHEDNDQFFYAAEVPRKQKCPDCGTFTMVQTWGRGRGIAAKANSRNSILYGRWHPQAGEVIRDYSHKRELMAKYGWEEVSDPDKGNRSRVADDADDRSQPDPYVDDDAWVDRDKTKNLIGEGLGIG